MKKWKATILSLLALTIAPLSATTENAGRATAATPPAELPFSSLTEIAKTKDYTAVASDKTLYLFDEKNGGFWQEYRHEYTISQMQFDERGTLYFRDRNRNLFTLNATEWTKDAAPTSTGISCGAFFLGGNELYYGDASIADNATLLYKYPSPQAYSFEGLYTDFLVHGDALYAIDGDNLRELHLSAAPTAQITAFSTKRSDFAIVGDLLYTVGEEYLYAYDLTNGGEERAYAGTYTAICASGDLLYALKDGKPYTLSEGGVPTPAAGVFTLPVDALSTSGLQADDQKQAPLVKTKPQALLAEVDFQQVGDVLSLKNTTRREQIVGLKLGEAEGYLLLAHWNAQAQAYKHYLVAPVGVESDDEGLRAATGKGYATNEVGLYSLPHLGFATTSKIPKGGEFTLLGEVDGLDRAYYKVAYDGREGYIPKAYAVDFDGGHADVQQTTVGEGKADKDGIWRMAYILLGSVAIGILVDVLILRKKHEE